MLDPIRRVKVGDILAVKQVCWHAQDCSMPRESVLQHPCGMGIANCMPARLLRSQGVPPWHT